MLSVDGTDCPFKATGDDWYSHKFKGSGVQYKVVVGIKGGDIFWIKGPMHCGEWPDISIFRQALVHYLDDDERVEADNGYNGEAPQHCKVPRPLYTDEQQIEMQA